MINNVNISDVYTYLKHKYNFEQREILYLTIIMFILILTQESFDSISHRLQNKSTTF